MSRGTTARGGSSRRPPLVAAAAGCALTVVAALWVRPMASSLWLDETGTVWLLQGSLSESLSRALEYQGGAPLFYVVEWLVAAVLGTSEVALRLPSLAAMAAATGFVFAIGRHLFGAAAGTVAAVVFAGLPMVAFAAADARPYALATMTLTGSGLALIRWVDSSRARDGLIYACACVATVYLHYLFALPLLAHGVYLLARTRSDGHLPRQARWVYAGIVLGVAPAVPTLLRVAAQRDLLSNPFPRTPAEIAGALLPPSLALVLVGGAVLAWVIRRGAGERVALDDGAVAFLLAWVAIPFVGLVTISTLGSATVLVPRYFGSVLPALALLAGAAAAAGVRTAWPPIALVAAVVLVAVLRGAAPVHTNEDWRAASARERALVQGDDTPVLLFAGFVEARRVDWVRDPERASYLNAPATAYSFDGEVSALPFGVAGEAEAYMEDLVRAELTDVDEFVLVTRGIDTARDWLDDRLGPLGFTSRESGNFDGEILVYVFVRS